MQNLFRWKKFERLQKKGGTGEILSHVVDKDGKLVKDEFEEHLLSLDLEEFKKIPIRVGVAYGLDKKEAILGVLRGGYVNVLITDEKVANYLIEETKITIKIKIPENFILWDFLKKGIIMKKVIKKKLEETKQHAFEKKVLQREKAKGAPRVGEFYKENDILLEDIDLGQIRIDMKREGEDITTEEIIETTKIIPLKDHMIEITIYERKDQKDSKEKRNLALFVHEEDLSVVM